MFGRTSLTSLALPTRKTGTTVQAAAAGETASFSITPTKEAIHTSDMNLTVHDINVAAQGRISLVILPHPSKEIISAADKYNMSIVETGFTNILY